MPVVTQIQFRRGTAAQWTASNPVLAQGELGYETDTGNFKIGNGSTAWNSLAVLNGITASTTATFTNKTINLASNTLTGTIAQFNTALSDGDFATLAGAETLTNKTLTAPRFANAGFIADANGNELVIFTTTASAVNEITMANAALGNSPTLTASGSDTNISLNLVAKGTGTVQAGGVPVATTSGSQTLTNKTINLANNTLSATSAQIASAVSDETGSGALVFGTTPTLSTPVINNPRWGYSTTVTAAGTTTLTNTSNFIQVFTGSTTQTVVMPVTSTLAQGQSWEINNNSTGTLTVNSSGGNLITTIPGGSSYSLTCIGTTLTTAADWEAEFNGSNSITGTGATVLATSPTLTTPNIGVATGTSFNSITGLSSTTPAVNGTAAVGTATTAARADHVHPTDTSRAATAGTLAQFAATTSAQLAGVISDETGSGSLVFANTPTLVTPNIGVATGTSFNSITGLSSTNPTALGAVAVGTATTTARADHVHPTTGLGLTASGLNQFASTTSAQLAGVISDETGSGSLVFGTSPTIGGTLTASGQINMTATNGFGNLQDYQTLNLMGCL